MSSHPPVSVLKADPAYRRRVLVVYATCVPLALVLFIALKQWGIPALAERLRGADEGTMRVLKVVGLACLSIPLGASVYLFRLGRRIQLSGQLPVPGARVIRDTPVVYGQPARRAGMVLVGLSLVAALTVVVAGIRFARL